MMEAVHATEEWQRAGVHYIRIQAMCVGFDIPLKYEFADDTKDSEYILVHENGFPVSTCRVRIDEENAGHIERVATLEEYRKTLRGTWNQGSRAAFERAGCYKHTDQFPREGTWLL